MNKEAAANLGLLLSQVGFGIILVVMVWTESVLTIPMAGCFMLMMWSAINLPEEKE